MAKTKTPAPDLAALAEVVDELGRLKGKIADLEVREKSLRDQLVAAGVDVAEGKLFHATVSRGSYRATDWKACLEDVQEILTTPQQRKLTGIKDLHTAEKERVTVKLAARPGTG